MDYDKQQVIALAATIQALDLVNDIATLGSFDRQRALPVFQGLLNYSPADTLSAFGNDVDNLRSGLNSLKGLLTDTLNRDIAQYFMSVVSIELKLVKNIQTRNQLREELYTINNLVNDSANLDNEENTILSDDVIEKFAILYKETASKIEPRIMVKGKDELLQQENVANQIRALLLSSLRGVAFFRHYEGKRIHFMTKRKTYLELIETL